MIAAPAAAQATRRAHHLARGDGARDEPGVARGRDAAADRRGRCPSARHARNPIRVDGPEGEHAYLARLRCADGATLRGSALRREAGVGAYGSVVGAYEVACGAARRPAGLRHVPGGECRNPRARRVSRSRPDLRGAQMIRTRRPQVARHDPALPWSSLCFAPTLVPPFLDRIYYAGPVSDHFDGQHFFNPDRAGAAAARSAPFLQPLGQWRARRLAGQRPGPPDRAAAPRRRPARCWSPGSATPPSWSRPQGLNILTDPIWSERASPFSFIGPRRVRAPGRALRGSAADRPRPGQPQSLRPYGPADAAAGCGSATGR